MRSRFHWLVDVRSRNDVLSLVQNHRCDSMLEGFLSPLQGLVVFLLAYPGLHPGLLHAALPGLKSRKPEVREQV